MFGYILPDKPNLYMKDYALYRSFYCGLCHQIKSCHGQCMRMSVSYDLTFISILLHGVCKVPLEFEKKSCILNPFKKKMVLKKGKLQAQCAYMNTLLVDFKCRDDLADHPSVGKKMLRALLANKRKKATLFLPEVASTLDRAYHAQQQAEKTATSWRMAADPFGSAISEILRILSGEQHPMLSELGYLLGQYVYLMDALDDYDKDAKSGEYNALRLQYGSTDRIALLTDHGEALWQEMQALLDTINERYRDLPIVGTEGIVTNTLWYGLPARAKELFDKENKKCRKTHTRF